jgi:hypothetical protein
MHASAAVSAVAAAERGDCGLHERVSVRTAARFIECFSAIRIYTYGHLVLFLVCSLRLS